jgi:hypothetical protein
VTFLLWARLGMLVALGGVAILLVWALWKERA